MAGTQEDGGPTSQMTHEGTSELGLILPRKMRMIEVTYHGRKGAPRTPVLPSWGKIARETIPSPPSWIHVVLKDDRSHSMVVG